MEAVSEAADTYQAAYDGFGRRVWERVDRLTGESQTYFVYDGDTLIAELDASGNPIAEYSWGLLGPLTRQDLQNPANNRYYVLDALGHTRALLDNQGNLTDTYVYDAWGNLLKGSEWNTPNPFTWNGAYGYQWIEFTGLYHIGAREYDPRVGRWLQRDPIGVAGGHPNVYLYCGNEPVNAKDPSGLDVDWAKRKLENAPWGKKKWLICIGDVSTGGLTSWFTHGLILKRLGGFVAYLRITGTASDEITIYPYCTSEQLLQALPSATHFVFIGHGTETTLQTFGGDGVTVNDLATVLNGRYLHEASLYSCYSSLTADFKKALVGNKGYFYGCYGPYTAWADFDMGPAGVWLMERLGRR